MEDMLLPLDRGEAALLENDGLMVSGEDGVLRAEVAGGALAADLSEIARSVLGAEGLSAVAAAPAYPDDLYDEAVRRAEAGEPEKAAGLFLRLAASDHLTSSSLYGLALSLSDAGRHREALDIALLIADSGFESPRALVLAGFAAYRVGEPALARRYLARASRKARGRPEYTEELRFAQRLLLNQQFGD